MTAVLSPMNLKSPTLHATIAFSLVVFLTVLVMSFVFKVEIVARGEGRVVPLSRVQVLQPEFAGRITAIHVRDGHQVTQGDILIELDPTEAKSELGALQVEQDHLRIELARIAAFHRALDLQTTDSDFLKKALDLYSLKPALAHHPFAKEQHNLLAAQVNDLLASVDQIEARMLVNSRSEEITNANIARVAAALDIQAQRLTSAEQLLDQGTTSRAAFLDVQQAFTELEREREIYLRELEQKLAEGAALGVELRRLDTELRRSLLDRQAEIRSRLATLAEEVLAAERRLATATLRAPASGIVDQLSVFTVGGVAEARAELLRIVPVDMQVEIEGFFGNQDMGFLAVGQIANISLEAYPSERFGFLQGKVSDIAADSVQIDGGKWGYTIRVTPDDPHLQAGDDSFPLRPGMTATLDVTTGSRRLISYFFAPIVRTVQDAMGER